MTIEFHCPHCSKLLKTPDDKAGVKANCPGCGQIVTIPIPDPQIETAQADPSFGAVTDVAGASPPAPDRGEADEGEIVDADQQHDMKPCPMCGAAIKKAAIRCRYCGETLVHERTTQVWEPTRIDAGDILHVAWETYKDQLGILIGAFAIWLGIYIAMSIVNQVLQGVIAFAFVGAGGAGGGGNPLALGFAVLGVTFFLIFFVNIPILIYLEAGMTLLWLRVARGERAEVTEMFQGGRFFWRLLGVTLIFSLLAIVAYFVVLLPGIVMKDPTWSIVAAIPVLLFWLVLALRFWAVSYVIVDRDAGIFEALQDCGRATANNYLAVVGLALAGIGLNLLGLLACGIGMLFTMPFIRLIFAVAYCGMTGQLTLRRRE